MLEKLNGSQLVRENMSEDVGKEMEIGRGRYKGWSADHIAVW